MVHPALAGLRTPLVEEGLPDLGRVSSEASTASQSPGLLPGPWPHAVRPLTPLSFCYLDLRPHSRKGSLQGTHTHLPRSAVVEPREDQRLNLGMEAVGTPTRVRLGGGVSLGRATRRGSGEGAHPWLPTSCSSQQLPGGQCALLSPGGEGPPC